VTREEANERLEDTFEGWNMWVMGNDSPASKMSKALGMAISALREQPMVHGHWDEGVNNGYCCCSNCRDVYILQEWLTAGKWNYCPNCGARMDGE
jgi:Zn finger protein HypA/HybF involved in hydrogenase expression